MPSCRCLAIMIQLEANSNNNSSSTARLKACSQVHMAKFLASVVVAVMLLQQRDSRYVNAHSVL